VHSGALENASAESESTFQSSREAREHLEVLRSTSEGYWSVWEVAYGFWTDLHFAEGAYSGVSGDQK
jgi:hypothetical protein